MVNSATIYLCTWFWKINQYGEKVSTALKFTEFFLVSLQQAGDIAMDAGQLQHALELYQAAKVYEV